MKRMRQLLITALLFQGSAGACGYIPQDLYDWTKYYAAGFGLDHRLLTAVIWTESKYCPNAVSKAGAIGLGQIMPETGREMGINIYDPIHNIYGTARYLRQQWNSFGDWNLALAAYNAGPGNVRKYGGIPPFTETQNYVSSVLTSYQSFQDLK